MRPFQATRSDEFSAFELSARAELRAARYENLPLLWAVFGFSMVANLLMLTGPIYMLQVYDRVLASRSVPTLIVLTTLVMFLLLVLWMLDAARARVLTRIGARMQSRLDGRVFDAVLRRAAVRSDSLAASGLRDVEALQRMFASPSLIALFDLIWTPIFLAGITLFHPWLGVLAFVGGGLVVLVTVMNQTLTREPQAQAQLASARADLMADNMREGAESLTALGMRRAAFNRWTAARIEAQRRKLAASDLSTAFTACAKSLRQFLQSAMLGGATYLVLKNELSPGAMIAGTLMLGRALAPVELTIGQWPVILRAVEAWSNLTRLLAESPPEVARTALPRPEARLVAQQASIGPPESGQVTLNKVSFQLEPGQALGVIGPSGAGKSTLARALTGTWPVLDGVILLGGAPLSLYNSDAHGMLVGYLPQRVSLFDGTVAENIARLGIDTNPDKVIEAAKRADAHEMILSLPQGYDTRVSAGAGQFSGGQAQRIGLARALFGDPVLLVLDEPNSNLDHRGSVALNRAVRAHKAAGGAVVIVAHRPAAVQECDLLLILENGGGTAFGEKNEVLQNAVTNHQAIKRAAEGGATP